MVSFPALAACCVLVSHCLYPVGRIGYVSAKFNLKRGQSAYLCPDSWAIVNARPRPVSSLIVQLRYLLHIPLIGAKPAKSVIQLHKAKFVNFTCEHTHSLWNCLIIINLRMVGICCFICKWATTTPLRRSIFVNLHDIHQCLCLCNYCRRSYVDKETLFWPVRLRQHTVKIQLNI